MKQKTLLFRLNNGIFFIFSRLWATTNEKPLEDVFIQDRMKNSIVAEKGFYSTATDSFDTNEMEIQMENAMLSLKQLFLLIRKPELLGLKSSDSFTVKKHGDGVVC